MNVRETSREAYREIQPMLNRRQREVMLKMHALNQAVTRKTLARIMGWPSNALTPRVLECIQKGFLEEHGFAIEDGRRAALVRIKCTE